jgi:hypothetical protein
MAGEPQTHNIGAIRRLLLAAFTPEGLRHFCQDHPPFQPVVPRFGPGQGLDDMVAEVIDHCQTQLLFDELLAQVQAENPRQYARFGPYSREPTEATPAIETAPRATGAGHPDDKRLQIGEMKFLGCTIRQLVVALSFVLVAGLGAAAYSLAGGWWTIDEPTEVPLQATATLSPSDTPTPTPTPTLAPTETPTPTLSLADTLPPGHELFQNFEEGNGTPPDRYFQETWYATCAFGEPPAPVHGGRRALRCQMVAEAEGGSDLHGGTVGILPATGGPVDLSLAETLSVWLYDERGGNTIELRLRDAEGNVSASYWSDRGAKMGKWTALTWDLTWFEGIDKRRIQSIDLYEWSDGVYHFDDITYTLVPQVEEFQELDARVFAEPFRAEVADYAPSQRLYQRPPASVASEVVDSEVEVVDSEVDAVDSEVDAVDSEVDAVDSEVDAGYQIRYTGVTETEYACWAISFGQALDVSERSTGITFDLKGTRGGELPHLWLQSCAPWGKVRNLVELEPASNDWQRVEVPLRDFHVIGGTAQTVDLTCLQEIALCFEWGEMAGAVVVDNITFESGP